MAFYRYTTQGGDRWDKIAFQFYNAPHDYVGIIQANPTQQGVYELPSGVVINVPIKEVKAKTSTIKPPWET